MKYFINTLICFTVINLFIYALGSFITLDLNPMNWSIMSEWYTRFFVAIFEIIFLMASSDFAEDSLED